MRQHVENTKNIKIKYIIIATTIFTNKKSQLHKYLLL